MITDNEDGLVFVEPIAFRCPLCDFTHTHSVGLTCVEIVHHLRSVHKLHRFAREFNLTEINNPGINAIIVQSAMDVEFTKS